MSDEEYVWASHGPKPGQPFTLQKQMMFLHEMYASAKKAGFNAEEAMTIVEAWWVAIIEKAC
jgi:hypothetical protein